MHESGRRGVFDAVLLNAVVDDAVFPFLGFEPGKQPIKSRDAARSGIKQIIAAILGQLNTKDAPVRSIEGALDMALGLQAAQQRADGVLADMLGPAEFGGRDAGAVAQLLRIYTQPRNEVVCVDAK